MEKNSTIKYLEYLQKYPKEVYKLIDNPYDDIELEELSQTIESYMEDDLYIPIIFTFLDSLPDTAVLNVLMKYIFKLIIQDVNSNGEQAICKELIEYLKEENEKETFVQEKVPTYCKEELFKIS